MFIISKAVKTARFQLGLDQSVTTHR